jgi:thioredoxin reductase/NAD-dependent dihydropyrimidine dehydrogenase PreA subunit
MWITAIVVIATLGLVLYSIASTVRGERESVSVLETAQEAGLTEPVSLHPVIDPEQCIGCGSCVEACPEQRVLGLIDGKAHLVQPSSCIGHGACSEACPTGAIALVFGTEKRGVDIPLLQPTFETNVPGIFIAGELGGMGLIRNAVEQGRQAVESIAALDGINDGSGLDLVIVGAGPAGFSASLAAKERGLRFVTLEQDTLGGTVAHYPRGKLVMTAPVKLPIVGRVRFRETSKEELLAFWKEVESQVDLQIRYRARVEHVRREDGSFLVESTRGSYRTRAVLLAIGRRGTPRKLGVPGEDQPKVVYRLIEPDQYRGRSVLVVGGGDSALEAATTLAAEPDARVFLSYRGEAFSRAKPANRERVEHEQNEGRLRVLLQSSVRQIAPGRVEIDQAGRNVAVPNDAVIVCAGGVLPTPFLTKLGIAVETKHGSS